MPWLEAYLSGADRVEQQGGGVGQHHMPKVGVGQAAALQLQTHKMGGGFEVGGAQLLA